jgi:hypothetical protein
MVVRMVDVKDIEFFPSDVICDVNNILKIFLHKGGGIELQSMVQVKLIRGPDSFSLNPFFQTIFYRMGWLLIGENHFMATPFQLLAEVRRGVGGSCPFPIAKKMKNLQRCLSTKDRI